MNFETRQFFFKFICFEAILEGLNHFALSSISSSFKLVQVSLCSIDYLFSQSAEQMCLNRSSLEKRVQIKWRLECEKHHMRYRLRDLYLHHLKRVYCLPSFYTHSIQVLACRVSFWSISDSPRSHIICIKNKNAIKIVKEESPLESNWNFWNLASSFGAGCPFCQSSIYIITDNLSLLFLFWSWFLLSVNISSSLKCLRQA